MAVVRDILEAIHQRRGGQNSGSDLFGAIDPYAVSAAETAAGITPANLSYVIGDLRRYGGLGDGTTDDSNAWQSAIKLGIARIPQGFSFLILTPAVKTGTITILGEGKTSKLLSDSTVITVTNGTGSIVDNFSMENITAPWIITRNPANWSATVTPVQSNGAGYQPTSNDVDIWGSLTSDQQNQQIGPVIQFNGAASNITVSRIYGQFVRIDIRDATDSQIMDCDIRGGKGVWGALAFDNWTNNVQRGANNRAVNNRVRYPSFSGVFFSSNDDFACTGNYCYLGGESGTKTTQTLGMNFNASVGGAAAGTLIAPVANGAYTIVFSTGETRAGTVTGGTAVAWSGVLNAGTVLNASAYTTVLNPQCFRGQISGNHCFYMFYDGLDCDSTFPGTCDAAINQHLVSGNYSHSNRGDGINADGQYNSYIGNHVSNNGNFGIWAECSFCLIDGNYFVSNNMEGNASGADILGGIQGNTISNNRVFFSASTGFPIYAAQLPGQVPHTIYNNTVMGGTSFFGNSGAINAALSNNTDATTGFYTDQSFSFFLQNAAGTLQHAFFNDVNQSSGALASKINGQSSGGFTSTPTGTDATTAFAAGAKISTTVANAVVLNTFHSQVDGNVLMLAAVMINSTTTSLTVAPTFQTFSVAGITLNRLLLNFYNSATGAPFNLNTTNIGSGTRLVVQFYGKLA